MATPWRKTENADNHRIRKYKDGVRKDKSMTGRYFDTDHTKCTECANLCPSGYIDTGMER